MRKNITIALVIEGTYPWYRGGVSEWIARYINAFPDCQFRILQIVTKPYLQAEFSSALYSLPEHIKTFVRIPPPAYHTGTLQSATWLQNYAEIVHPVFSGTDIVHAANTGFAGWLGMKMAGRFKKPLILTEHALYWKEIEMGAAALECGYKVPSLTSRKKQMAALFKQMAQQIYASADKIISVSQCNIPQQRALGASSVRYIANGVDEYWLQPIKKRNDTPVIGWVGRCADMKNPLRFFEVIEAFRRWNIDARFVMVTCGAGEQALQRRIEQKAKQYAELKIIWNQPAEAYYTAMDALCITSRSESQPLVLFEALAKKVLPVGWQVGDVSNRYGLVIPSHQTAEDLVRKMISVWHRPELWKETVETRFEMVKRHHTWPAIFEQYRQLFNKYTNHKDAHEC